MRITVVYLAGSRAQAGCERETFELSGEATPAKVAAEVSIRHKALAPLLPSVRWARRYVFVEASTPLADGDELALLPPVSGGAPRASLTNQPLDPLATLARVQSARMGAAVLFIGTVRNHSAEHAVSGITYEAYEPMAAQKLEEIALGLSQEECEVAITHRHGKLEVGELAVVIAAAAPHRDQAFTACREALELVKKDVPIWKQEHTDEGSTWVGLSSKPGE